MRTKTISDHNATTFVYYDGPLTKAHYYEFLDPNLETWLHASGNAKLYEQEDSYSPEFGEELAVARAKARFYEKKARRLARLGA